MSAPPTSSTLSPPQAVKADSSVQEFHIYVESRRVKVKDASWARKKVGTLTVLGTHPPAVLDAIVVTALAKVEHQGRSGRSGGGGRSAVGAGGFAGGGGGSGC